MIRTRHSLWWEAMLTAPLEARIMPAPAELVEHVMHYNMATDNAAVPRTADECADFLDDVRAAVAELPAIVIDKMVPRLLGIYAMTGLGSSAITDVIAYPGGDLIGAFVAIDIDAFAGRQANEWASWKENQPFTAGGGIELQAVVAGATANTRQAAIQYILLHEFGHAVAADSFLLPNWWEDARAIMAAVQYPFLQLSWKIQDDGTIVPRLGEDFPMRRRVKAYEGEKLPASDIPSVYRQLSTSTFPTLYGASSVHEDFAESFATYVHVELMGKPREVIVRTAEGTERYDSIWKTERGAAKLKFFRSFFEQPTTPFRNRARHEAFARISIEIILRAPLRFLGLAPFLRLSIGAVDLRQVAEALLGATQADQENPFLWMNLATVFFATEQRNLGLSMQNEALRLQRTYVLPASGQPARFRLLMLMAPGDLAENTPLDCLLEDSEVEFILYYATDEQPLPAKIPPHDAVMVAFSDTEANHAMLHALENLLHAWPKPVINAPQHIPNTERSAASALLQNVQGLLMPPTVWVARTVLQEVADGRTALAQLFDACRFPIILRPVGSHAGRDLARVEDLAGIVRYLDTVSDDQFYISNFVDYRSDDGLYRKYRIAIVDGQPFACHMAISSHWMIHYVNAGMYEDSMKRAEEASFMQNFATFAERHGAALHEIHVRSALEYLCIDCAEARTGELLIFEIDHAMVVHAMDSEDLFPHKQVHMLKVQRAVEDLLFSGSCTSSEA